MKRKKVRVVKSFKNHNRDREQDEFEEDLTRGKSLEEKAPDTSDAMKRENQTNISRGKNENF